MNNIETINFEHEGTVAKLQNRRKSDVSEMSKGHISRLTRFGSSK